MEAVIKRVENGENLVEQEIKEVAKFLLDDGGDSGEQARFLKAFSAKGETVEEISGLVECFLDRAVDPGVSEMIFDGPTIDVCGTGGDKLDLFNVSTTSMFVIAAGGATVVKHGNRGITSKSGGADVLEYLGVKIDVGPSQFQDCLGRAGVGFLFAQKYHPAFKAIGPVRAKLAKEGIRTVFNLMGPLLNPARPECQLVGVFDDSKVTVFAEILKLLGRSRAWAVNGQTEGGKAVDEVSLMGETRICKSGFKSELLDEVVTPEDFGLKLAKVEDLKGGNAEVNAGILEGVLKGDLRGAKRDMVLLNAGAGLACAGVVEGLSLGVKKAGELIDSGAALERLRLLQEVAI